MVGHLMGAHRSRLHHYYRMRRLPHRRAPQQETNDMVLRFALPIVTALAQSIKPTTETHHLAADIFIYASIVSFMTLMASMSIPRKYPRAIRMSEYFTTFSAVITYCSFVSRHFSSSLMWIPYLPCIFPLLPFLFTQPCRQWIGWILERVSRVLPRWPASPPTNCQPLASQVDVEVC